MNGEGLRKPEGAPAVVPGAEVRKRAARALGEILASRSPAEKHLSAASEELEERDRRLLSEIVLGSLRRLGRLDHVLESASGRSIDQIQSGLRAPLRVAAYQLLFLQRVPAFAAVDRAVADARRRAGKKAAGFANAVLRKIAAKPDLEAWPVDVLDAEERLAIEESHPRQLVASWIDRFGEARTRDLLRANNTPRPLCLLALNDPDRLSAELAEAGVAVEAGELAPRALHVTSGDAFETDAFHRGAFYVQDEASQAAALIPPPRPGERVLDAAAAPGGKGFSLRAVEPVLPLVASDASLSRMMTLRENYRRLGGYGSLVVARGEAAPFRPAFDRVIADLPCSGTGTLSRHPELKWRISRKEVRRLAGSGLRILQGLASAVRPGGLLIAITCSIESEENEDVVAELLRGSPDLRLVDLAEMLPAPLANGVEGPGRWRVLPRLRHDGFTVHVLRKL